MLKNAIDTDRYESLLGRAISFEECVYRLNDQYYTARAKQEGSISASFVVPMNNMMQSMYSSIDKYMNKDLVRTFNTQYMCK